MNLKELKRLVKEAVMALSDTNTRLLYPRSQLVESSFSRVKSKIEDAHVPFVMITAYRGVDKNESRAAQDAQRAENNKNQGMLKARAKAAGFPWVDMRRSGYKEGGPEGGVVEEYSVLMYEEPRQDVPPSGKSLFDTARLFAADYNQDSFLYGGPDRENDGEYSIRLYSKDGAPIKDVWAGGEKGYTELGVVDDAEAEYWSMIDHKKTQFKELKDRWTSFQPKSKLEAMKKQYYIKLAETTLKESDK